MDTFYAVETQLVVRNVNDSYPWPYALRFARNYSDVKGKKTFFSVFIIKQPNATVFYGYIYFGSQ